MSSTPTSPHESRYLSHDEALQWIAGRLPPKPSELESVLPPGALPLYWSHDPEAVSKLKGSIQAWRKSLDELTMQASGRLDASGPRDDASWGFPVDAHCHFWRPVAGACAERLFGPTSPYTETLKEIGDLKFFGLSLPLLEIGFLAGSDKNEECRAFFTNPNRFIRQAYITEDDTGNSLKTVCARVLSLLHSEEQHERCVNPWQDLAYDSRRDERCLACTFPTDQSLIHTAEVGRALKAGCKTRKDEIVQSELAKSAKSTAAVGGEQMARSLYDAELEYITRWVRSCETLQDRKNHPEIMRGLTEGTGLAVMPPFTATLAESAVDFVASLGGLNSFWHETKLSALSFRPGTSPLPRRSGERAAVTFPGHNSSVQSSTSGIDDSVEMDA